MDWKTGNAHQFQPGKVLFGKPAAGESRPLDIPVDGRKAFTEQPAIEPCQPLNHRLKDTVQRIAASEFIDSAYVVAPLIALRQVLRVQLAEYPPSRQPEGQPHLQTRQQTQSE